MAKPNGRSKKERFVGTPHRVMDSEAYASLSFITRALIQDLLLQFNGKNNGDLSADWTYMKSRGWKSKDTLQNAFDEALGKGFVFTTRKGFKGRCSLYAVTWSPLSTYDKHECKFDSVLTEDFKFGDWREKWKTWDRDSSRRARRNPRRKTVNAK